ncbi:TonB-dependent receptor domain-containing protein [Enterovirga sp. GCM10030262]|uniref:TonB-dependent receptor domain-containing protein n=1 Tax=Enterovirga sp. GCM10030262 TaxID=3273391 RepID=UPI0036228410
MAQDAPETPAEEIPATDPAFAAAPEDTAIVVTGSRLIRSDLAAPSPLTVVGEDDIKLSGSVTIENTINEFPQLSSGNTSNVNNGGGSGVLTANLRGLGATRTLVLVNGRRFIPANSDGQVDLSSIPDALIKRVEIITGGASAVYGSDAIAGAVNFILDDSFDGVEASYQYGQTFEDDGASHKIDLTVGTNLDENRGNVTVSGSYTKRNPIFQSGRAFSAVPLDTINGELVPGGSSAIPGTRISLSSTQRDQLVGVNLTPSGACTSITGIRFGENGQVLPYCNPEDAYNYSSFNYLQRPLERIQVSTLARYELSDAVEIYGEAYYVNTRNRSQLAPDSATPVTPGAGSGTLLVPNYATNPGLSDAVRDFFTNNAAIFDADGDGTAAIVGAGRRYSELGPRQNFFERNAFSLTTGLRGSFELADRDWNYDSFFQYQRNRTDSRTQNLISGTRLSQGLDTIVDADGDVVCRNQVLGCVPVNIFGLDSITPEAGRFITPIRASDDRFTRTSMGASLSGTLFDLPAGPVALAMGVEHRKDSYVFNPSPLDLANEYGAVSQAAVEGGFNVSELFGELRVPILSDMPFADTLALEGAARYSDYGGDNKTVGGVFTWKIGAEYAPVDWFRFRSAFNRAIRAPTINELKDPISTGFTSGEDPCVASRNPSQAQQDLCVAQGVLRADLPTFTQANVGFDARTGGNPNLTEERSKTFTFGAVVSPPFIPRLNITVDYFKVSVDDAIARINANQTLNDCFTTLDQNSATCQAINRFSNGQINFVSTQLNNIGSLKVEGIDAQVDYRLDLPFAQIGGERATLALSAVASFLFERSTQVIADQDPLDCSGHFGGGCTGNGVFASPDLKLNLSSTYNSGPLTVRLAGRMIGDMKLYPGLTAAVLEAPAQWYFDAAVTAEVMEEVELFGGIDNLFDNQPPILGTAISADTNTDPSLYDVVGRRFFMGARLKF